MGGKGSGRPPSIGTLIKRAAPQGIAVGTAPELVLPNFAGVKSEALRTSTVDITGSGAGGHIIQEEGLDLTARTYLNFSGAAVTAYDDSGNDTTHISITSSGTTQEQVEDWVGAMFSGNTETLITATYQDADGTIDLVVDNDLANYSNTTSAFITASSSDALTNKSGSNSQWTNDEGYITATLTNEQVQDIVGAMVSSNTETLITVTYQDTDGTIDFVVDNDLSNYSNATTGFLTAATVEAQVDHDNIVNTHNLTTDIDHDQLTNYSANEHIDWTNAASNFKTTGNIQGAELSGSSLVGVSGAVMMMAKDPDAVQSGVLGDVYIPYPMTISTGRILSQTSGAMTVNVWVDSVSNFPPTSADSVGDIILSSGTSTSTSLSTSLSAGDVVRFNCSGASTVSGAAIVLEGVRG